MKNLSRRFLTTFLCGALSLLLVAAASAQIVVYDNTTGFQGSGAINGGVTSETGTRQTLLLMDDLTYNPAFSLLNVSQIIFSLANFNSTSQALSASLRIFNSDGANGGPGTFITGFNFNPITVAATNVTLLTFNVPTANQFPLPASGTIWAGVYFSSSTQTAAVLDNFGMGLFNPPTTGSSQDRDFLSSGTGTQTTNNPAGSIRTAPFSSVPLVANYGFRFTVIPEPTTVVLCALGATGLLIGARRTRRSR